MPETLHNPNPILPGKLDSEQLDALHMEMSVVSPAKNAEIKAEAALANETFLKLYGKYCRPELDSDEISERIITTDHDHSGRFTPTWFSGADTYTSYEASYDAAAYAHIQGHFILSTPPDIWPHLNQENKQRLVNQFGSKESAEQYANDIVQYSALAHELTHLHQTPDLPLPFKECGGYYYGREIAEHDRVPVGNTRSDACADFYKHLLETYGDDVHKLSFGTLDNAEKAQQILTEFSPEVTNELFPHMQTRTIPELEKAST